MTLPPNGFQGLTHCLTNPQPEAGCLPLEDGIVDIFQWKLEDTVGRDIILADLHQAG